MFGRIVWFTIPILGSGLGAPALPVLLIGGVGAYAAGKSVEKLAELLMQDGSWFGEEEQPVKKRQKKKASKKTGAKKKSPGRPKSTKTKKPAKVTATKKKKVSAKKVKK